jgi:hypothetical protein
MINPTKAFASKHVQRHNGIGHRDAHAVSSRLHFGWRDERHTPSFLSVLAHRRRYGRLAGDESAMFIDNLPVDTDNRAQDLESAVAGGVAESVVDLIEPVQVKVQQREGALVAPRAQWPTAINCISYGERRGV